MKIHHGFLLRIVIAREINKSKEPILRDKGIMAGVLNLILILVRVRQIRCRSVVCIVTGHKYYQGHYYPQGCQLT